MASVSRLSRIAVSAAGLFMPIMCRARFLRNANQIGDGLAVTDGAITASTNTLACHTSTPFASPVVAGSTVIVLGAGPAPSHTTTGSVAARGVPLVTTIATITDTGDVVLNATDIGRAH